jgi:hypothetical protein
MLREAGNWPDAGGLAARTVLADRVLDQSVQLVAA